MPKKSQPVFKPQPSAKTSVRNCGECLFNDVVITELDANGVCPRCGANYGPADGAK